MSRRTLVSHKILEEAGVLGDISVEELPLHFIPYEDDVLNLALDDAFGDLYLVGHSTSSVYTSDHECSAKIQHAYSLLLRLSCPYNTHMVFSPGLSGKDPTRNG